jgi:hypothetical protein
LGTNLVFGAAGKAVSWEYMRAGSGMRRTRYRRLHGERGGRYGAGGSHAWKLQGDETETRVWGRLGSASPMEYLEVIL